MSTAEDNRIAAQRRAEELVARIRSEKESKATSPTGTGTNGNSAPANTGRAATPERTQLQIPTPARPESVESRMVAGASITTSTESSTAFMKNKPSLSLQAVLDSASSNAPSSPSSRVTNNNNKGRDPTPTASPSRRTGPPSSPPTSPLRAAQAASAIDMANAAIESAKRVSGVGSFGGGGAAADGDSTTGGHSIGSAVYIPTSSGPTSPNSIGQSGSDGDDSGSAPVSPASNTNRGSNLDLRSNDSAFHVMANMLVTRLMSKLAGGATSYTVDANDRAFFDKMVPHTVRWSFVDALRYRLTSSESLRGALDENPMGGGSATEELARKCCWLGLDRPEGENVLLQPHLNTVQVGFPNNHAAEDLQRVSASLNGKSAPHDDAPWVTRQERCRPSPQQQGHRLQEQQIGLEKKQPSAQQELHKQQKQQMERQKKHIDLLEDTPEHSTGTGTGSSGGNVVDASRAKAQILAELNEARDMMRSAKTSETTNFWMDRISVLEGRLRDLGVSVEEIAPVQQPQTLQLQQQPQPHVVQPQPRAPTTPITGDNGQPDDVVSAISANKPQRQPPSVPHLGSSASQSETGTTFRSPNVDSDVNPAPMPPSYQPVYDGLPMVDVIAPADLPAGYTFEAQMGSKRFLATVPPGGVRRGDRFSCPMKSLDRVEIHVPTGRWRDGMFDILRFGAFHPLLLNSIFSPLIAVGQIMSRNHLTWLGDHGSRFQSKSVCTNMLMAVLFWGLMNALFLFVIGVTLNRGNLPSYLDYVALVIVNALMLAFTIFAVARTRQAIRAKYHIPHNIQIGGEKTEDYLCATFCMPCTITQMGRHTADFETYRSVCCSSTGLPKNLDIVPEPLAAQGNMPMLNDKHFV